MRAETFTRDPRRPHGDGGPAAPQRHPPRPPPAPAVRHRAHADAAVGPGRRSTTTAPLTLGDLAEHERVAPPSVTKVVTKLEADGLVVRARPTPTTAGPPGWPPPPTGTALVDETRRRKTPGWPAASPRSTPTSSAGWPTPSTSSTSSPAGGAMPVTRFRRRPDPPPDNGFRSLRQPQLPPVLRRPAHLPGRQLADARRPDAAHPQAHRQRRRRRPARRRPVRPVLVLGPWAGLVADRSDKRRLLLIVQTIAMLQSFALAALAFTGRPAGRGHLRRRPGRRLRPPPSTTRPAARSWSRWCPRTTSTTR